jgi:hypothetical protein
MGVGCVNGTARGRCPESVVILSIADLNYAFAAGPRLEKGQYLSFARKFHRGG